MDVLIMDYGGANYIQQSMLVEIKNGQTAIVISRDCGETMVIVNNPRKAYGVEAHIVNETNDIDKIRDLCRKTGFPTDFIFLHTASTGEVYVSMECVDSLPIAICVKEIEENDEIHLKLCKVIVQDYIEKKTLKSNSK